MTPPLDDQSAIFLRGVIEDDIWQARDEPSEMKARIMEAYAAGIVDQWDVDVWFALWGLGNV